MFATCRRCVGWRRAAACAPRANTSRDGTWAGTVSGDTGRRGAAGGVGAEIDKRYTFTISRIYYSYKYRSQLYTYSR